MTGRIKSPLLKRGKPTLNHDLSLWDSPLMTPQNDFRSYAKPFLLANDKPQAAVIVFLAVVITSKHHMRLIDRSMVE
jgi:hypothetical protein